MGLMGNRYKILGGKTQGKRPLRRPRLKWEVRIRMDIFRFVSNCLGK